MNDIKEVAGAFTSIGGQFILPPGKIRAKLDDIKAFVFDWDGVFNNGFKSENAPSMFAEPDAAGLNLLRYSFYQQSGTFPPCAIITGETNPGALYFAKREHFSNVYMHVMHKPDAVQHFCTKYKISPEQVACVFDDMNDLSMAKMCGLRFMVKKSANPAFHLMAIKNNWCDYITGNEQDKYPVREICELVMSLAGTFEKSLLSRVAYDEAYQQFLKQKKSVDPVLYKANENGFNESK